MVGKLVMTVCMLAVAAGCGALGAFLLRGSGRAGRRLLRARRWPGVLGRVTRAELVRVSLGARVQWRPEVAVAYEVDGRAYSTGTLHPLDREAGETATTHARAAALLRRFPPGAPAAVTYDPADPADALLVPEGWGGVAATAVAGAVFLAAGLGIPLVLVFLLRHGTATP